MQIDPHKHLVIEEHKLGIIVCELVLVQEVITECNLKWEHKLGITIKLPKHFVNSSI